MSLCVYVCVVVEVYQSSKTGHFSKEHLRILEMTLLFYVCAVVEGM